MIVFQIYQIRSLFLFLFLSFIGMKTFAKNEIIEHSTRTNPVDSFMLDGYIMNEQKVDPIVYQDTVILDYPPSLPLILDGSHLKWVHSLTPECPLTKPLFPPLSFAKHPLFADVNRKNAIYKQAYDYMVINHLDLIKYTKAHFSGEIERLEEMPSNVFQFLFKVDYDFDKEKESTNKPERFRPKRKYWFYKGNHRIQLSQNYISPNWYKGGIKNFNLVNAHGLSVSYKKNKFETNNLIEWKFSLYTNPNDTLRYRRIGEDLIRIYSDFGLQAFKNWYYSTNIEIKTQAFKNFKENSDLALSSVFSPVYINIGVLGMRYQKEKQFPKIKGKKLSFNTDISPLSIQYVNVFNKEIDPKRFGIPEGKRHLTNLGSTVNAKLVFNFNKNVNFTSRFSYFTNYEKVTAESENTLNMPINRYFSTTLYLFVRFDDNKNLARDRTLGYFQVNEMLTFGFNYNW